MKTYSVSARDNGKSSNLRKSYNESNFADRTSSSTVHPVITTKRWIQSKAVSSQKLGLTNVLSNNRTKLKVFLNSFFSKLHKIFMKFNAMINTLSLENVTSSTWEITSTTTNIKEWQTLWTRGIQNTHLTDNVVHYTVVLRITRFTKRFFLSLRGLWK